MSASNGANVRERGGTSRRDSGVSSYDGGMFKWSRATLSTAMNGSLENGFMRSTRVPYRALYALVFTLMVVMVVLLLPKELGRPMAGEDRTVLILPDELDLPLYNTTYPLTRPRG